MNNNLCIVSHLGLGDHLICNAIVRHHAAERDLVVVPCKFHNLESVSFMFRDLENVVVRGVLDHDDQVFFASKVWKHDVLWLGLDNQPFDASKFDQEFYRQARLPFDLRWDGWKVKREQGVEIPVTDWFKFTPFLHEDKARGMVVNKALVPGLDTAYSPTKERSGNIFAYHKVLETVPEIHCINSSFALLVDSIHLPQNPKLYLHLYARPGGEIPTFRKNWIQITDQNQI